MSESQKLKEPDVIAYVSKCGFDYVGGYHGSKKPITVRCRQCGRTFDRVFHMFSEASKGQRACECPLCRAEEVKKRRVEKEQERKHEAWIIAEMRADRRADLISRQIERRLANRVCKNCGITYNIESSGYNSEQYCSKRCMKRWAMRVKNDRRLRRIMTRRHDNDITLEKLFARDGGVCYLCGCSCDWVDVDDDGNACNKYPSIDHVIPIAKGGAHTWDNVRLAHRGCNTAKGSTV